MNDKVATALAILEKAMNMEQRGFEFYSKAASLSKDEKGRDMFNMLARDEQEHQTLIEKQYASLGKAGKWSALPAIRLEKVDLGQSLFPAGQETMGKEISEKSDEMDALLFGINIETLSYDMYRKAAIDIDEEPGKTLFEFLAGQERSHFNILMMRYEFLTGRSLGWAA